jgi:hypothetical protein
MIENHITALVIIVPAILVIIYDLWVFLTKGGPATLSWTMCLWGMRYPVVVALLAVLAGHLFVPECLAPGQNAHENVTPVQGTVASILGILGLGNLLWCTWRIAVDPVIKRSHIVLLGALMLAGIALGHFVFPQFVACRG